MKRREFRELIQQLEVYSRQSPATYRLKVLGLALLGYAYLVLIFVILLVLVGGTGFLMYLSLAEGNVAYIAFQLLIKVGIPLMVLIWIVLRAVWVKIPPPDGCSLSLNDAPRLHQLAETIQKSLNAPVIHEILLTPDFNAGIVQWPRLGIFGWPKNYLLVGLPLMASLSPSQFQAVLAHEFGHLSGRHGFFSVWIYRLRMTWGQLLTNLETGNAWGSGLFTRFVNWFAPYFDAYAFVIGREHEYEADDLSAQVCGLQKAAEALIASCLMARYLDEEFWPEIQKQLKYQQTPPEDTYTRLSQACSQRPTPSFEKTDVSQSTTTDPMVLSPESGSKFHGSGSDGVVAPRCEDAAHQEASSENRLEKWLQQELRAKTSIDDTHPSLSDRLQALASQTDFLKTARNILLKPGDLTAAEEYLQQRLPDILKFFDHWWHMQTQTAWAEAHKENSRELEELARLEEKAQNGDLNQDERWSLITAIGKNRGDDAGRPLLLDFLRRFPDHHGANFTLGVLLINQNDPQGEGYLSKLLENDPELSIPAYQYLVDFWHRQGQDDKAESYRERLELHSELLEKADTERGSISAADQLIPHDLPEEVLAQLRNIMSQYPDIKEGFVARKAVFLFPDRPCYIIGIITRRSWWRFTLQSAVEEDQLRINQILPLVRLPGSCLLAALVGDYQFLIERFQKIPNAHFFQAP